MCYLIAVQEVTDCKFGLDGWIAHYIHPWRSELEFSKQFAYPNQIKIHNHLQVTSYY